jgi:hypothetical protein
MGEHSCSQRSRCKELLSCSAEGNDKSEVDMSAKGWFETKYAERRTKTRKGACTTVPASHLLLDTDTRAIPLEKKTGHYPRAVTHGRVLHLLRLSILRLPAQPGCWRQRPDVGMSTGCEA